MLQWLRRKLFTAITETAQPVIHFDHSLIEEVGEGALVILKTKMRLTGEQREDTADFLAKLRAERPDVRFLVFDRDWEVHIIHPEASSR
ncbi:hypothetical protein [Bordetella sp. 15P40C-2]|uniref:hypothetical protein n=1 Tax=Bordetella sp. 15P40C-2 TaxID=2572246 RepID=UPI00132A67E4|nr:hypothetical protein [Bordetella sp. 15P40C-2]MVW72154.1 hypothetical protein [Bordetella sp. 15P40C-2]